MEKKKEEVECARSGRRIQSVVVAGLSRRGQGGTKRDSGGEGCWR